jgi:hypothetical protein
MTTATQKLVSFERFVALLNDELWSRPQYRQGMEFLNVDFGYDFIAPSLDPTANRALDKSIFDRVSVEYKIAR